MDTFSLFSLLGETRSLKPEEIILSPQKQVVDYSNVFKYLEIGRKDQYWYERCKESLVRLLPDEDIDLAIDVMCATSMNTSLKSNISQFIKMMYVIKNDLPFPSLMPNMAKQLELVKQRKPLTGRKIFNFSEAMKGNPDAIVVDIWILRAFNVDKQYKFKDTGRLKSRGAPKRIYDEIEAYMRSEAPKIGIQPRQMCAMIWSGVRTLSTNKGNTTTYEDLLSMKLNTLFNLL